MKVLVVGGGPSGLFLSLLLKKRGVAKTVVVRDQNPKDATFGFGVTIATHATEQLADADQKFFDTLHDQSVSVRDQVIRHPDGPVEIDSAFSAISIERLALLKILQARCEEEGVDLVYDRAVSDPKEFDGFDLVVGADGANSFVRRTFETEFGASRSFLDNHFAWYGVDCAFDNPTLSFKRFKSGGFVAHYYRYTPQKSTFVAECDTRAWADSGLGEMNPDEQRRFIEAMFSDELEGRALIDNRSLWRRFQVVTNRNWVFDKFALIGDAVYTAHFSIGSGTRLAIEDSLALADAVSRHADDVGAALQSFENQRRMAKSSLSEAARRSYLWYEDFADALNAHPLDFAFSYMTRTGRMTRERLRAAAPRFMAAFEAHRETPPAAAGRRGGAI